MNDFFLDPKTVSDDDKPNMDVITTQIDLNDQRILGTNA